MEYVEKYREARGALASALKEIERAYGLAQEAEEAAPDADDDDVVSPKTTVEELVTDLDELRDGLQEMVEDLDEDLETWASS